MFTNDTFSKLGRPSYTERENWKPTYVGNNVVIGSGATILPVRICDYAIVGAGAVVTKDIIMPGIYVGNPARFLKNNPNNTR
jgi:acetyltransferase-like isoleucine patch superfamily enzyme